MDGRIKRIRLGLALIVLVTFVAVPSMADEKVSLFNPFSLQSRTVVVADSAPSVGMLLLAAESAADGRLSDGDPRPTISLRGQKVRIPSRPNLRSAYSRTPAFDASIW